ncbi:MAG: amidophosphoribosyltransferase [Mycoplasmataceae bacterium]|jgi:amidophosphoribosyltransferase|nr:amidophosphoribosyltransferase [Mycoplasmataceae bacterium]
MNHQGSFIQKPKEACGIFGIFSKRPIEIPSLIYYGLFSLQHRGQEGTGITVSNFKTVDQYKNVGSVGEIFNRDVINDLNKIKPCLGIGHVRYSTAGAKGVENVQPLLTDTRIGPIAVAHNGNLINADLIRDQLERRGSNFYTSVDSEAIIKLISKNLVEFDLINAVKKTILTIKGAFSLLIMTKDKLIGVRDPYGIRPLCLGRLKTGAYVLSSESCALDVIGATFIKDLNKGEMVVITKSGIKSINYSKNEPQHTCIFEYVYFARPDSTIDGINCYLSRIRQGELLYKEHHLKADMVICAPDSGVHAATGYAQASGIPYGVGLIKNRYVARTFIKPTQELREHSVYIKLNPLRVNIANKDIILIDDSVVRGTTSHYLVKSLKQAGAKKVYLLLASPVIQYPCFLGIDTPNRNHLLANKYSFKKMQQFIGCDYLGFLSLDNLIQTCGGQNKFCTGCFNGKYPVCPSKIKKTRFA